MVSSVMLVPTVSDVGVVLECQADTPGLDRVIRHKWKLPVQCKLHSNLQISRYLSIELHELML